MTRQQALPLNEWGRRVALARDAGQQTCALFRMEEGRDYVWNGSRHVLSEGSPFAPGTESSALRAWMDQWRISSLRVHVPSSSGPVGYLVAEWFTPHPLDVERLALDHGYTPDQIQQRIPHFAQIRDRARAAGQLECTLLAVTGGYDYTGSSERGYELDRVKFRPLIQWASQVDCRLVLRVPDMYDASSVQSLTSLDPPVPCAFGHLVCSWEVPPSSIPATKMRP